jgi:hypothetical protein
MSVVSASDRLWGTLSYLYSKGTTRKFTKLITAKTEEWTKKGFDSEWKHVKR